jgi:hypothetical protein
VKDELTACRREVAKAHAVIYCPGGGTTRTRQQTGAATARPGTETIFTNSEREYRKNAQIITYIENQPTL